MAKPEKRPKGRPLAEHSDTERLDLLVKLIGYGRKRGWVCLDWGEEGKGPLTISTGPAEDSASLLAEDRDGDLRRLLDRALSPNASKVLEKATKA